MLHPQNNRMWHKISKRNLLLRAESTTFLLEQLPLQSMSSGGTDATDLHFSPFHKLICWTRGEGGSQWAKKTDLKWGGGEVWTSFIWNTQAGCFLHVFLLHAFIHPVKVQYIIHNTNIICKAKIKIQWFIISSFHHPFLKESSDPSLPLLFSESDHRLSSLIRISVRATGYSSRYELIYLKSCVLSVGIQTNCSSFILDVVVKTGLCKDIGKTVCDLSNSPKICLPTTWKHKIKLEKKKTDYVLFWVLWCMWWVTVSLCCLIPHKSSCPDIKLSEHKVHHSLLHMGPLSCRLSECRCCDVSNGHVNIRARL